MSSKKHKQRKTMKNATNSKSKNDPEVFVLTPDILQKLGINLGNLKAPEECPTENCAGTQNTSSGLQSSYNENGFIQNISDDSTILETADLMKKSILLSPTFVSVTGNMIPGEVEIVNGLNNTELPVSIKEPVQPIKPVHIMEQTCDIKDDGKGAREIEVNNKVSQSCNNLHSFAGRTDIREITKNNNIKKRSDESVSPKIKTDSEKRNVPNVSRNLTGCDQVLVLKSDMVLDHNTNLENKSTQKPQNIPIRKGAKRKIHIISEEIISPKSNIQCFNEPVKDIPDSNFHETVANNYEINEENTNVVNNFIDRESAAIHNILTKKDSSFSHHNSNVKTTEAEELPSFVGETISISVTNETLENLIITSNDINVMANMDGDTPEDNLITMADLKETEEMDISNIDGIPHEEIYDISTLNHSELDGILSSIDTPCLDSPKQLPGETKVLIKNESANGVDINSTKYRFKTEQHIEVETNLENLNTLTEMEKNVCHIVSNKVILSNSDNVSSKTYVHTRNENNNLENNICTETMKNISGDKVAEIALYLSKYAKTRAEKRKRISKKTLRSQLCFQGIEKPGGVKTYKGAYKKKKAVSVVESHTNQIANDINIPIDTENVGSADVGITRAFCMCSDFGKLHFYEDSVDTYVHTHFLNKQNNNCRPESIFEIFDENYLFNFPKKYVESEREESDTSLYMCWNEICCNLSENEDVVVTEGGIKESIIFNNFENKTKPNKDDRSNLTILNKKTIVDTEILPTGSVDETSKITAVAEDGLPENCASAIKHVLHASKHVIQGIDKRNTTRRFLRKFSRHTENTPQIECKILDCTNLVGVKEKMSTGKSTRNFQDEEVNKTVAAKHITRRKTKASEVEQFPVPIQPEANKSLRNVESLAVENIEIPKLPNNDIGNKNMEINSLNECETSISDALNVNDSETNSAKRPKRNSVSETLPERTSKKRKSSLNKSSSKNVEDIQPSRKKHFKCGVCGNLLSEKDWDSHVATEHCFIAWKTGETINLEDTDLLTKLKHQLKDEGSLKCSICTTKKKTVKNFITHVKVCLKSKTSVTGESSQTAESFKDSDLNSDVTKCGVCKLEFSSSQWSEHVAKEHGYLAWKHGTPELDMQNEEKVYEHLYNMCQAQKGLTCNKCGVIRKHVKSYITHTKKCFSTTNSLDDSANQSVAQSLNESISESTKSSGVRKEPIGQLSLTDLDEIVKCGVCKQDVKGSDWLKHIGKEHNYIAWQNGQNRIDHTKEENIKDHLENLINVHGVLTCYKCGINRKFAKNYIKHMKSCVSAPKPTEVEVLNEINITNNKFAKTYIKQTKKSDGVKKSIDVEVPNEINVTDTQVESGTSPVKCGVCKEEMEESMWIHHILKAHQYLAWKDGEPVLNVEDEDIVRVHLYNIIKKHGCLICHKCGIQRKYVKPYLLHISTCNPKQVPKNDSIGEIVFDCKGDVTCAVCHEKVNGMDWMTHIQQKHNYLAWREDQTPLDLENADMIREYLLLVLRTFGSLVCGNCGEQMKIAKHFIRHIERCSLVADSDMLECVRCHAKVLAKGWKEHNMEYHHNLAWYIGAIPIDIQNMYVITKYLSKYKEYTGGFVCKKCGLSRASAAGLFAHIVICGTTEAEQDIFKKECEICHQKYLCSVKSQHMKLHRDEMNARAKEIERKEKDNKLNVSGGRRKAAEKANNVIAKLKSEGNICRDCGFVSDKNEEMFKHVCANGNLKIEYDEPFQADQSDDESLDLLDSHDSDDTNPSDDCSIPDTSMGKKSGKLGSRHDRLKFPFTVENSQEYLKQGIADFLKLHFTEEILFPKWRSFECTLVPENELTQYLPQLKESCSLYVDNKWTTLKLFEHSLDHVTTFFTGGSIQCVSCAPAREGDAEYVCAVSHRAGDRPRLRTPRTRAYTGLIQIWELGDFCNVPPKLALGIAHNNGTTWAIDWCPSGARQSSEDGAAARLGLLVAAFSTGRVFVYSVPHPAAVVKGDSVICTLKHVAELRMTMSSERERYQATAVNWSTEKGHTTITVGYSDGSVAQYNLLEASPLLRAEEDGVDIFYPYFDERMHNHVISDVDTFPGAGAAHARALSAASPTGVCVRAGAARLQSRMARACAFTPHWPMAVMAGDDAMVNKTVCRLEWWGTRPTNVQACSVSIYTGDMAAFSPPLLKISYPHPLTVERRKRIKALLKIKPLSNTSKKKQFNYDNLGTIVEPLTYDDAIKKYGVKFQVVKDVKTISKYVSLPYDQFPERFPLAEVTSMDYCKSNTNRNKIVMGTMAGLVFILDV